MSFLLVLAAPAQFARAASGGRIECGIFEYVAATSTDPGSIAFGASSDLGLNGYRYSIAPGASVPANLGDIAGAPTCLQVTHDGRLISEMHYVASGSVRGPVVVYGDPINDPGNAFYVTAGRVMTPAFALGTSPGMAAILNNAVATGEEMRLTFTIDTTYGVPTDFTAWTLVRGAVVVTDDDISVGVATLPAEIIDSTSRSQLEQAEANGKYAKVVVTASGLIDLNVGIIDETTQLDVKQIAPDLAAASIGGPCSGPDYYGVFDNSSGARPITFRLKWSTTTGVHVQTKSVPAGATYKTWEHWTKPGTMIRVSYKNPGAGRWINLASRIATRGYFPGCTYEPGY